MDMMSYHWVPVPKNNINENFWTLSLEELHISLANDFSEPSESSWLEIDDQDNTQTGFFPINTDLRAILSLSSSVIMLPSRNINQLIKLFSQMNINCYMKDMNFKCNNFKSTDQIKNLKLSFKFANDN